MQMNVNHSARSGDIIRDIVLIYFNMKVYCVFSLESPYHWSHLTEIVLMRISKYDCI